MGRALLFDQRQGQGSEGKGEMGGQKDWGRQEDWQKDKDGQAHSFSPQGYFWEGWGQLSSKWHLRSLHLSVAGSLASGFWKHFLCSRQRLVFAGLKAGPAGGPSAETLLSRVARPLCTSSLLLGRPPLLPSRAPRKARTESPCPSCPGFCTDFHVNLTCPLHTEGPSGCPHGHRPPPSYMAGFCPQPAR